MKRCNFDSAVIKLLLSAASMILTCTIVSVGIISMNQAKLMAGITSNKISRYNKELAESDVSIYDGVCVRGSDIVNFYKRHFVNQNDGSFVMTVKHTAKSFTYLDGSYLKRMRQQESEHYIKPTNQYQCTVVYNINQLITEVVFELQVK